MFVVAMRVRLRTTVEQVAHPVMGESILVWIAQTSISCDYFIEPVSTPPIKEIVMKRSEIRSLEAIRRRIKILEIIENNPMSTKMIYTTLEENRGRVMEDIKRLKEWGYIEELPKKIYCELGLRSSSFYQRADKAYEGYEFLKEMAEKVDIEKALKEYRNNYGMFNAGNAKLKTSDVYIKVPSNPNATIVMNSNRPAGFYAYQKPKPQVNRGIGSTFSLYDGAL